jgi:hypothetical protein
MSLTGSEVTGDVLTQDLWLRLLRLRYRVRPGIFPFLPFSMNVGEGDFSEGRIETVRKGVRVTLRACIWPLYRVQNEPDRSVLVPCGPAFRVPPGVFGQFQETVRKALEAPVAWSYEPP